MTTEDISNLTGKSFDRIQQFAKSEGIEKVGPYYDFTEEEYQLFVSRIGKRGRPAKVKK